MNKPFYFISLNSTVAVPLSLAALLGAALFVFSTLAHATEPWTLERSIRHALAHSPDARLTQHRIAVAQAGLEQANVAFWPRLQIQSGYTRSDHPMTVLGSILNQRAYSSSLDFNHVQDLDNFNAKGLVTVPLYSGGRTVANREFAKANTEAARHESAAVHNALSFEVSRAFHTVLKTRKFIDAAEAAVSALEANLGIARKRLEGGTLLKSDVLDIEVRLAQGREDLVRARNANTLAERTLRNLLGIEEGPFTVADTAPSISAPTTGDFCQRPELAAARERERAVVAQVRGAKGGYKPRVSAFAGLDYDYGSRLNGDGRSYTAGLVAQWNLWDGHDTRAKIREAKANLEAASEEQRKLRFALHLEIEQARLNLEAANERLAVSEKSVAQAAESTELIRNRFEQGLALATQLLDAETALIAARVRRAETEADQRIAIAALRKAFALPQLDNQPVAK